MNERRILVTESHPLRDSGDIGTARRAAVSMAAPLGLDLDAVALCVTELSTNQLQHGGGGLLQPWTDGEGLELLSVQLGADRAGGSGLGAGLETLRRFAAELDIDAIDGAFVVRARFGPPSPGAMDFAVVLMPLAGYVVSGDGVLFVESEAGGSCVVIDVLGHGPAAAADRDRLLRALDRVDLHDPHRTLRLANESMRGRRGAAMLWVSWRDARLRSFGVGNVRAGIVEGEALRWLPSEAGIVGRHPRPPRVQETDFGPGARLVISSDGIDSRSRPQRVGSRFSEAARLLREHRRAMDDCTVVLLETPA